jgi:hypothetical protein
MSEIDLLKRSSFAWEDLFDDESALMASGFNAWGGVFFLEGRWHAVGGGKNERTRLLGVGERTVCLAQADDWLNEHETDESAFKSRRWLGQAPTEKQLQYLSPAQRQDYGLTRYRASALITFQFNRRDIRRLVMSGRARAEGGVSHVAQVPSPPAAAPDRPRRDRLWHPRPVLCAVCTARTRGFGWFDPHRPRRDRTQTRRWFCSMGCQAAFTRKAKRGLSMVDFTEEETQALPAVMRALAPEMERIGWDRPLGPADPERHAPADRHHHRGVPRRDGRDRRQSEIPF